MTYANIHTTELIDELKVVYLGQLKNLKVTNPRLIIRFSGPTSSGKSTVAKALEAKFKAIRVEDDVVLRELTQRFPGIAHAEMNPIRYEVMDKVWEELATTAVNGLLIADSSIDRSYDKATAFSDKHGYAQIIISMNVPESTHREWVIEGGDREFSSAQSYLNSLQKFRADHAKFLKNHTPDLILEPGYNIDEVYNFVYNMLNER